MINERIKELRLDSKESQEAMGKRLGVAQRTVAGWENGNRQPNLETIVRISEEYGVSTDYLLGRTDSRQVYVHEDLEVGDGRKAILLSATRKDLPPEDREQVQQDLQRALRQDPVINLQGCSLSMDSLVHLIREIVDQSLESHKSQADASERKL